MFLLNVLTNILSNVYWKGKVIQHISVNQKLLSESKRTTGHQDNTTKIDKLIKEKQKNKKERRKKEFTFKL